MDSPKLRIPRSPWAAPAATIRGIKCSSRGCDAAPPGASRHFASICSRVAGSCTASPEPGIEGGRSVAAAPGEHVGQVVIAHAAAHDENPLIPQRRQDAAERQMQRRVEAGLQRQLQDGNVCIRIDEQKRHEYSVIEPAPGFNIALEAGFLQQRTHAFGQVGSADRRIFQAIGVLRKAVVVEQQTGLGRDVERWAADSPNAPKRPIRLWASPRARNRCRAGRQPNRPTCAGTRRADR